MVLKEIKQISLIRQKKITAKLSTVKALQVVMQGRELGSLLQ